MEREQVVEKLKETLIAVKEGEGAVDARAGNAGALRQLARSQRLLIDCMVGLLHVGALEAEPDEPQPEPEEQDDEFDPDTLKAVYVSKKTAKKR